MSVKHKKQLFHLRRLGLMAALLAALFIVRFDAGASPVPFIQSHVLAYASEMSHGGLLSGTNAARASNGLASLTLDGQLNNSAQMKAQDMAQKNYWAHVAPDGTQPWYFFNQAGYAYIRAGENLAYGFSTSQGAVDGWMNSPSHKANILGNYNDVGFGIVNAPDYQSSGNQTIVVAHYGSRNNPSPPPPAAAPVTPPPQAPEEPATPPSAPVDSPAPPVDTEQATQDPVPTPDNQANSQKQAPTEESTTPASPVQTGSESQVSVLSLMAQKNIPLAALASLLIVCSTVVGYALTHRVAFHHSVIAGEHFVMKHPGIDTGIIAAITTLILLTTYGNLS